MVLKTCFAKGANTLHSVIVSLSLFSDNLVRVFKIQHFYAEENIAKKRTKFNTTLKQIMGVVFMVQMFSTALREALGSFVLLLENQSSKCKFRFKALKFMLSTSKI